MAAKGRKVSGDLTLAMDLQTPVWNVSAPVLRTTPQCCRMPRARLRSASTAGRAPWYWPSCHQDRPNAKAPAPGKVRMSAMSEHQFAALAAHQRHVRGVNAGHGPATLDRITDHNIRGTAIDLDVRDVLGAGDADVEQTRLARHTG